MRQVQGLPELLITLGRRRLPASEVASVDSVRVRLALGQPGQCEITWHLPDAAAARRLDAAPGDALRVELGGRREPLFVGEVTVTEYAHGADASLEIRVRGYDALHRLRMRQHTRVHDDVDLADLARALADGTGLSVDGGAVHLGRVYQCARSDLDLLVQTSARVGLYPVVDGTTLRLLDLSGEGEPLHLELGSSLHAAALEVSQEPSYRSTETVRWDPARAEATTGRARSPHARASVQVDPAPQSVGGGGTLVRADEVMADGALADALAQADLDVRSAAEVTAVLVAEGDPALRAGRQVRVSGVVPRLEGLYTVCEAVHTIDGTGYETTLSTRPPAGPGPRPPDVVTLGVVDRVDDPEARGRAQVRLPAYPHLVTPWVPVLVAAAGPGKGVVALPDEGDTVLVLLPGRDPGQAVVLGGLYGTLQLPDADDDGSRGGRYSIRTADGQQVTLSSHGKSLRLTDGHGSVVELGPELMRLSSATDLLIEAPGKALRVRARTVDFEEAT